MTSKEISRLIIDTCESVKGTYAAAHPGYNSNWSYVCCEDAPHLLEFCLTHAEFSHWTHRYAHSVTIYFHCEGSPTGVCSFGSFDAFRLEEAYKIRKDALGAGMAWAQG